MTRGFYPPVVASPVQVLDGQGAVAGDVNCVRCGYNVRGLLGSGRCPECGAAVSVSLRGALLRFSDPAWIGKLYLGVRLIFWGIIISIVSTVAGIFLAWLRGVGAIEWYLLAGLFSYGVVAMGAWMLTQPDPSGKGEDQYGKARKIARTCIIIGMIGQVLNVLEKISPIAAPVELLMAILNFLLTAISTVKIVAMMQYLSKLAMRVPNAKISDRLDSLKRSLGASDGLYGLMKSGLRLAIAVGGRRALSGTPLVLSCGGGIAGLLYLIFGVMFLHALGKMGKQFKEQGAIARELWNQEIAQN